MSKRSAYNVSRTRARALPRQEMPALYLSLSLKHCCFGRIINTPYKHELAHARARENNFYVSFYMRSSPMSAYKSLHFFSLLSIHSMQKHRFGDFHTSNLIRSLKLSPGRALRRDSIRGFWFGDFHADVSECTDGESERPWQTFERR